MKTKIIYAVVSSCEDTYLEQALISAYSVLLHNPGTIIELVTDKATESTLVGNRTKIKDYLSKVIVVDVPDEMSKVRRSRYLKTNLRNFVEGDYLFLDTDTIICSSLAEIDNMPYDICAVREQNKFDKFTKEDWWMFELASKVGMENELMDQDYFNSGVMYVKDNVNAHDFYQKWYDCWSDLKQKGVDTDQTSLCWANKLARNVIKHINDSWNCQIKRNGFYQAENARILHYYYGAEESQLLVAKEEIFNTIKEIGYIPTFVDKLIKHPLNGFLVDYSSVKFQKKSDSIKYVYDNYSCFYKLILSLCKMAIAITNKLHYKKGL